MDLSILDIRFGFSTPDCACYQLERSGGQEYGGENAVISCICCVLLSLISDFVIRGFWNAARLQMLRGTCRRKSLSTTPDNCGSSWCRLMIQNLMHDMFQLLEILDSQMWPPREWFRGFGLLIRIQHTRITPGEKLFMHNRASWIPYTVHGNKSLDSASWSQRARLGTEAGL